MTKTKTKKTKEPKEPKRGTGRPRAEINWTMVDQMLMAHVKIEDIAGALGISSDTLYKACEREHNMTFTAYCQQKRAKGVSNARMIFYKEAFLDKGGDPKAKATKQIFWLKNHAEMSDKIDTKSKVDISGVHQIVEIPDNATNPGTKANIPKPWEQKTDTEQGIDKAGE